MIENMSAASDFIERMTIELARLYPSDEILFEQKELALGNGIDTEITVLVRWQQDGIRREIAYVISEFDIEHMAEYQKVDAVERSLEVIGRSHAREI